MDGIRYEEINKMKKIISILITAAICAAMALPVMAEDKITAEEVRDALFAKGLCAYPELCEMTAQNWDEEDILHPTAKVSDVIDIDRTICTSSDILVNSDLSWELKESAGKSFSGVGKDAFDVGGDKWYCVLDYYPKENTIYFDLWDLTQHTITLDGFDEDGIEDMEIYQRLADSINAGTHGEVKRIEWTQMHGIPVKTNANSAVNPSGDVGTLLYVETTENKYVITFYKIDFLSLDAGTVKTVDDMIVYAKDYYDNKWAPPEMTYHSAPEKGSEIRDTDTRAAYIGTDSIYSDVKGDFVSYVNELSDLGIITGYEDGSFCPDGTISRAEVAAMIGRMLHYSGEYDGRFADVPSDAWYAPELAALTECGIINGTGGNEFSPEDSIRYVDLLKIIEGILGYNAQLSAEDYEEIVIDRAMELGLTSGVGSFEITAPARRGNIAVILSNALDTHIQTAITTVKGENSGYAFTIGQSVTDITLIDYINGGTLNGELQ